MFDDECLGSIVNIYNELNLLPFQLQFIQLLLTEKKKNKSSPFTHLNYTKAINLVFPSFSLEKNKNQKTLKTTILRGNFQINQEAEHVLLYHLKNSAVRISSIVLQFPFI